MQKTQKERNKLKGETQDLDYTLELRGWKWRLEYNKSKSLSFRREIRKKKKKLPALEYWGERKTDGADTSCLSLLSENFGINIFQRSFHF